MTIIRELEEELELKLTPEQIQFIGHGTTIAGGEGIASLFYLKIDTSKTPLVCHEGTIEIYSSEEFEKQNLLPGIRERWEDFKKWRDGRENNRIVTLNFRNSDTINRILSGQKTIETRALNPEEPMKYF